MNMPGKQIQAKAEVTDLAMGTVLSGTAVALVTTAVLSLIAQARGRHPVETINATSHWFWGDKAARTRAVDGKHTAVGFVTHHLASMLWASVFQFLRRASPGRSPLTDAAGVTALAAVVDYAVVPKRLTPGWEKVVPPAAIALAYGAMMIGLIATCPPGKTMRARN
jgi:hypothetical protein